MKLIDFINAQPDNKVVNMREYRIGQPCGCLLVQFAKSIGITQGSVGISEIPMGNKRVSLGHPTKQLIKHLLSASHCEKITYKYIKEKAKEFKL